MLVLTRQLNESIMIGDDVEITIVDVRGEKVRLGIRAPREIPVHRKEVYLAIRQANVEATQTDETTVQRLEALGKLFGEQQGKGTDPGSGSDKRETKGKEAK